jgi:hypothetical protein
MNSRTGPWKVAGDRPGTIKVSLERQRVAVGIGVPQSEYLNGRHSDGEIIERFKQAQPEVVFYLADRATGAPVMRVARPLVPLLAKEYVRVELPGTRPR